MRAQIDRDNVLAGLTKEQAEAVQSGLGEALDASERRALLRDLHSGFFFFALGYGVSLIPR